MQASAPRLETTPEAVAAAMIDMWRDVLRGSMRSMHTLMLELDVTLTQLKALHVLDELDGEVSIKGLAGEMHMSLPNASRVIEALLCRGFIERREDPHDRRSKRVCLSAEGRDTLRRIELSRLDGLESWASRLSDEQRVKLLDALSSLPTEHRS